VVANAHAKTCSDTHALHSPLNQVASNALAAINPTFAEHWHVPLLGILLIEIPLEQ